MIDKFINENCIVCKSCYNACPVHAIYYENENTYLQKVRVNNDLCINCGKCIDKCLLLDTAYERSNSKAFSVFNKNDVIRKNSTSGGIFFSLANYFLNNNGYVCGCILDENINAKHIISNNINDIYKMMGSKYVQSDIGDCFRDIKVLLEQRNAVLFTGCPCHVLALHKFLGKKYDNLYTMDFVCHGTPTFDILNSYVNILEVKHKSKIVEIKFRDKRKGWHNSGVLCKFENGREYFKSISLDPYIKGFLSGITIKSGCFNCKVKNFSSQSDFTVGDYWGAEVVEKDIDDNKGLSAVIIHTEKAENLLSDLTSEDLFTKETNLEDIIKYNKNIVEPTKQNKCRDEFFCFAESYGLEKSIKKYLYEKPNEMIKRKSRRVVRGIYYKLKGKESLYD